MRALLLVALGGCAHMPTTPLVDVPLCSPAIVASVRSDNVCDGAFTAEGLACVACSTRDACYDQAHAVYCVEGGCQEDPRCHR